MPLLITLFFFLSGCDASSTVSFGSTTFTIEVADTVAEQQKGLMFRKNLCETCGMLFDFHAEQPIAMWMKDTPLPLDMLFLNAKKEVIFIAAHTTPYSIETIQSPFPTRYILELNAGSAEKYNIHVGDIMQ
ncbi:MAG: DUF192 domain-containing protein [Alphaproteobacteria bacterium]|nr:DUF192 domain-containing protein [Alphaproteobacteria bacterium]